MTWMSPANRPAGRGCVVRRRAIPPSMRESLVFGRTRTLWIDWIAAWSRRGCGRTVPEFAPAEGPSRSAHAPLPDRRSDGEIGKSGNLEGRRLLRAFFQASNCARTGPYLPIVRKEPILPAAHPAQKSFKRQSNEYPCVGDASKPDLRKGVRVEDRLAKSLRAAHDRHAQHLAAEHESPTEHGEHHVPAQKHAATEHH